MSAINLLANRNSTPAGNSSSLRPPSSRSHHLSADLTSSNVSAASRIRPASDYYGQTQPGPEDITDTMADQWLSDINSMEALLEETAQATLDQDFKDELSAIEQWFRVLSSAERTASLYALLQQTTPVQVRFFLNVLGQMAKGHGISGVLSPANYEKDPMSSRLNDAMSNLSMGGSRNSNLRTPGTPGAQRHSTIDQTDIDTMFPEAVAAIADQRAKFSASTGQSLDRNSLTAPSISASGGGDSENNPAASPWGPRSNEQRPKSSSGQPLMGQFMQPPPSAGLRSPRFTPNLPNTLINAPDMQDGLRSPYAAPNASWASQLNTPMVANFQAQQQADMIANATAMKMAALSTVNNRFALDDVRKYRRARSNERSGPMSPGLPMNNSQATNVVMINENGQILNRDQFIALQNQQNSAFAGLRSRPSSPGLAMQGSGFGQLGYISPQNNGFLTAYDGQSPLINNDMVRGRSPRGRRGTSKPPEDPTDPSLLQDIPSWLRSLRLHKYTDNLKDMSWPELIELDDKALEERGVNALGARRKMLKVFEQVKEAKAEGKLQA